jgi:probable rRNA maturation factor
MTKPLHPGTVYYADEQDEDVSGVDLAALALVVFRHEGLPDRVEVTLLLVDEETIATYNDRFMGREGPTDVLAFPLEELDPDDDLPDPDPAGPPLNVGDVVIAPSYVRRQALEQASTFEDEMALMVVHGMLHLLGWDHATDEDAERMEAQEAAILTRVGRRRR